MPTRLQRFQGSLMGVRIGDPLGIAWETLTEEQILSITGPEGVTTFWNPQQRSDAPEWAQKLKTLNPGDPSDDWQMTSAGARSLIRCLGRLDLNDLAKDYLDEMEECDLGWGETVKAGLRELQEYMDSNGQRGRRPGTFACFPKNLPPNYGCGNGVAMRIAPFALLASRNFKPGENTNTSGIIRFFKTLWGLGGLTHPDPRATVGAYAVSAFIMRLASRAAPPLERQDLMDILSIVYNEIRVMEFYAPSALFAPDNAETFTNRMKCMIEVLALNPSTEQIRKIFPRSSYTLESVPFSLAMFLHCPTNFRLALKKTVEAGGDTDTNAAIVGSLVGANVGIEGIPPEWRYFRDDFVDAEVLGSMLHSMDEEIHLTTGSAT